MFHRPLIILALLVIWPPQATADDTYTIKLKGRATGQRCSLRKPKPESTG